MSTKDQDTSTDYVSKSSIWSPEAEETVPTTNDEKRENQWDGDWRGDDISKTLPEQYKMGQTFSHEYFAALADTFYGMYEGYRLEYQGMDNYRYITRETLPSDVAGFHMVQEFFPEYHQYTARIDSAKTKTILNGFSPSNNTFKLQRSTDVNEKYTFKSQYIKNIKIIGNTPLNILGNAENNYFEGNDANNEFDGSEGIDVLKVNGKKADYVITKLTGGITQIVGPSIGTDKITNVEFIKFNDMIVKVDD